MIKPPTTRRAALVCVVGLLTVVLGSVIGNIAGTAITVVGSLATVYGMVFLMVYGFTVLLATVSMVVHLFRRKPPT